MNLLVALVFYSVAMFGLAYIVGHATISRGIRERLFAQEAGSDEAVSSMRYIVRVFVYMLECPACFGFWTGLTTALFGWTVFDLPMSLIAWGLYTAGSNFIIAKTTKLIS